jgi:hypothetical protein
MLALAVLSGILLVGAPACAKKEQRRDHKERQSEGRKKRPKKHQDGQHRGRKKKADSEMNGVHQR